MTIHEILDHEVPNLELKREALQQRLRDLAVTKGGIRFAKEQTEHVLRTLDAYIVDCFPQVTGTADEDWRIQEEGIVKATFDKVQELAFELHLIERDIRATASELETVLKQLSLCTLASHANRTFVEKHPV